MKAIVLKKHIMYLATIGFFMACLGCGSTKELAEYQKTAAPLRYSYLKDTSYRYSIHSEIEQIISIPQRDIQTRIQQDMTFHFKPTEQYSDSIQLAVVVDSFGIRIRSPQGVLNPDLSYLTGREFDMRISGRGEGLSTDEARALEFEIVGTKRNLEMLFAFLWPKLPEEKVRVGHEWMLSDTIIENYEGEELKMILASSNSFVSVDTLNGVACARIISDITGKRSGTSQAQGVPMTTTGSITGSGSFYLAVDGGYLVKDESIITVNGSLTIQGPQVETYPLKMKIKSSTVLKR